MILEILVGVNFVSCGSFVGKRKTRCAIELVVPVVPLLLIVLEFGVWCMSLAVVCCGSFCALCTYATLCSVRRECC